MKDLRLLVVDDELPNLQKLRRTFVKDFEVHEARSGEEALQLLRSLEFDAIITDQRMPGVSGVDLLQTSLDTSPNAVRIILTGYTEVGDLMNAINQGKVDRYVTKPWDPFSLRKTVVQDIEHRKLKKANELFNEQLRIAAEVQSQLFPQSAPLVPNIDYFGICYAATEIGGDYYDFLALDPDKLWLAIGDISGKGISAALLMANLQALLRSHIPRGREKLSVSIGGINRMLHDTTASNKFATLFCGVYNAEDRSLNYVNAGHCCPLLIRPKNNGQPDVSLLEPTGAVLGIFRDLEYTERTVHLECGDTLLAFTDGVTEALDGEWKEFGEDRLEQFLVSRHDLSPKELVNAVLEVITEHRSGISQQDDITMLAAKIL